MLLFFPECQMLGENRKVDKSLGLCSGAEKMFPAQSAFLLFCPPKGEFSPLSRAAAGIRQPTAEPTPRSISSSSDPFNVRRKPSWGSPLGFDERWRASRGRVTIRELPDIMSAKFSDFFTPSPLSAFEIDLYYNIHATSLTTSAFP